MRENADQNNSEYGHLSRSVANTVHISDLFLYPLKTSENQMWNRKRFIKVKLHMSRYFKSILTDVAHCFGVSIFNFVKVITGCTEPRKYLTNQSQ